MCSGTESLLLAPETIRRSIETQYTANLRIKRIFSHEIEPFKQAHIERNFYLPIFSANEQREHYLSDSLSSTYFSTLTLVPPPTEPGHRFQETSTYLWLWQLRPYCSRVETVETHHSPRGSSLTLDFPRPCPRLRFALHAKDGQRVMELFTLRDTIYRHRATSHSERPWEGPTIYQWGDSRPRSARRAQNTISTNVE